jgi:hypothetical protein
MKRLLASLCGGWVCLAVPSSALAQDGQPVYTAPPPSSGQTQTQTQPAPNQPPPVVVAPAPEQKYFPRFRWGVWFEGGPYFYGSSTGGAGGTNVRMGVQVNEMLGFYGQAIGVLGGGASVKPTGTTPAINASAFVGAGFAAMADLTLGNLFFIAAGPELMAGIIGADRQDPKTLKTEAAAGAFFSIAARMGLALGNTTNPKQRRAFTFGLDFHMVLTPFDPVIAPMIALGYDQF